MSINRLASTCGEEGCRSVSPTRKCLCSLRYENRSMRRVIGKSEQSSIVTSRVPWTTFVYHEADAYA
jgi:hypothetical protein